VALRLTVWPMLCEYVPITLAACPEYTVVGLTVTLPDELPHVNVVEVAAAVPPMLTVKVVVPDVEQRNVPVKVLEPADDDVKLTVELPVPETVSPAELVALEK